MSDHIYEITCDASPRHAAGLKMSDEQLATWPEKPIEWVRDQKHAHAARYPDCTSPLRVTCDGQALTILETRAP